MSIFTPWVCSTVSTASLIIERVFKPRKSILISPVSSITEPSYCVTSIFSPVSLSTAVLTGTQSVMSSRQMIVPQACTPVPRTLPSRIFAYLIVSRIAGSSDSSAAFNSGTALIAFLRLIFRSLSLSLGSGIRSGTHLQSWFDTGIGNFCTRATSFSAIFVAIVP